MVFQPSFLPFSPCFLLWVSFFLLWPLFFSQPKLLAITTALATSTTTSFVSSIACLPDLLGFLDWIFSKINLLSAARPSRQRAILPSSSTPQVPVATQPPLHLTSMCRCMDYTRRFDHTIRRPSLTLLFNGFFCCFLCSFVYLLFVCFICICLLFGL